MSQNSCSYKLLPVLYSLHCPGDEEDRMCVLPAPPYDEKKRLSQPSIRSLSRSCIGETKMDISTTPVMHCAPPCVGGDKDG